MVVRYDHLHDHTERELRRVLRFLGVEPEAESAVECALRRREGIYKRPRRPLGFDPFDSELRALLSAKMEEVYSALGIGRPPPPPPTVAQPLPPTATGRPKARPEEPPTPKPASMTAEVV